MSVNWNVKRAKDMVHKSFSYAPLRMVFVFLM